LLLLLACHIRRGLLCLGQSRLLAQLCNRLALLLPNRVLSPTLP
jgi:hypothetical protein